MNFAWFAAAATVIGAIASVFRPDNSAFPFALSAPVRALVCALLAAVAGTLQGVYGGATWPEAFATAFAAAVTAWAAHGATRAAPTALLLCSLAIGASGCSWLTPGHLADLEVIAGCILEESAKVAPGYLPSLEEAAIIATKCGARDAQQVLDLVSRHHVAERLEGARR